MNRAPGPSVWRPRLRALCLVPKAWFENCGAYHTMRSRNFFMHRGQDRIRLNGESDLAPNYGRKTIDP